MSGFWSFWVTLFSIACWAWILYWLVGVLGYRPTMQDDGTTGHEYDGIQESLTVHYQNGGWQSFGVH